MSMQPPEKLQQKKKKNWQNPKIKNTKSNTNLQHAAAELTSKLDNAIKSRLGGKKATLRSGRLFARNRCKRGHVTLVSFRPPLFGSACARGRPLFFILAAALNKLLGNDDSLFPRIGQFVCRGSVRTPSFGFLISKTILFQIPFAGRLR